MASEERDEQTAVDLHAGGISRWPLGLIPGEFQKSIVMTAAVSAQAHNSDAALALIHCLGSPAAVSIIKASRM